MSEQYRVTVTGIQKIREKGVSALYKSEAKLSGIQMLPSCAVDVI